MTSRVQLQELMQKQGCAVPEYTTDGDGPFTCTVTVHMPPPYPPQCYESAEPATTKKAAMADAAYTALLAVRHMLSADHTEQGAHSSNENCSGVNSSTCGMYQQAVTETAVDDSQVGMDVQPVCCTLTMQQRKDAECLVTRAKTPKVQLHELMQKQGWNNPEYSIAGEGPFTCTVTVHMPPYPAKCFASTAATATKKAAMADAAAAAWIEVSQSLT